MLLVQMRLSWWNGGTRQMMLLPQQQHPLTRQRLETSGRVTGFWIFCLLVWSLPLSSLGSFTSMYPHEILWQKRKKKKNIFLGLMIEKQQASLWFLALAQVPSSVPASPHLELVFLYLLDVYTSSRASSDCNLCCISQNCIMLQLYLTCFVTFVSQCSLLSLFWDLEFVLGRPAGWLHQLSFVQLD